MNLTTMQIICIIAAAVFLICFILLIISFVLSVKNNKNLKRIMMNSKNGDLADKIEEYYNKIEMTAIEIREARDILNKLRFDCSNSFGQMGVVSFDAFNNMHGGYSFSIAVLNQHNDGFILTSLYGNDSCNTYIKSIKNGESSVQLMNEEREALQKAFYHEN